MTTGAGLTLLRNARRVAEVWLDEAESLVGGGARFRHLGDLEARRALRRKLHCRPFRWYLENIFPDHDPLPRHTAQLVDAVHCCVFTCLLPGGAEAGVNPGPP